MCLNQLPNKPTRRMLITAGKQLTDIAAASSNENYSVTNSVTTLQSDFVRRLATHARLTYHHHHHHHHHHHPGRSLSLADFPIHSDSTRIISEMKIRHKIAKIENKLVKHWFSLSSNPRFVTYLIFTFKHFAGILHRYN